MTGGTHSLVALTGAVVLASQATTDITQAGILIGASVATAKLPDVDCKIPGISHRGPATHSLMAVMVLSTCVAVASGLLVPEYALWITGGVYLGTVLHVLADALTISGVPAFWPAVRADVHLLPAGLRVRTDGPDEAVLAFLLLAGLLGFVWMTYGT